MLGGPRHTPQGAARSKPTIEIAAVEVGPSTARRGRPTTHGARPTLWASRLFDAV